MQPLVGLGMRRIGFSGHTGGGGFVGFALEVAIGEGMEFAVYEGDEGFEGEKIARRPALE